MPLSRHESEGAGPARTSISAARPFSYYYYQVLLALCVRKWILSDLFYSDCEMKISFELLQKKVGINGKSLSLVLNVEDEGKSLFHKIAEGGKCIETVMRQFCNTAELENESGCNSLSKTRSNYVTGISSTFFFLLFLDLGETLFSPRVKPIVQVTCNTRKIKRRVSRCARGDDEGARAER